MKDYANAIVKELETMGLTAEVKDVEKANGVIYTGLAISVPGTSIAPTIYIDDMYKANLSVDEAAQKVKAIFDMSEENGKEFLSVTEDIRDYEKMKEKLSVRLYNQKTNVEVFMSAKRYGFDDLIIVPVINVGSDDNKGSIKVSNKIIDMWGVDKKTVFKAALANTKKDVYIENLFEVMAKMNGMSVDDVAMECFGTTQLPLEAQQMVVTNSGKMYGASAILFMKSKLKKKFAKGFFVIPSSVHEVLVIPNDGMMSEETLANMINQVNSTVVAAEEVLSDKAYSFV